MARRLIPPAVRSPEEKMKSEVERREVEDFGQVNREMIDERDIRSMIEKTRSFTEEEFHQKESLRREENNSCEYVPPSSMIRYSKSFHGLSLYLDENVLLNDVMIRRAEQLAFLLVTLGGQVFDIPRETIHLFRDLNSGNNSLSLFSSRSSQFVVLFSSDCFQHVGRVVLQSSLLRTSLC